MRKIPLTQGKSAIVDDADYDRIMNSGFRWYATLRGGIYYAYGTKGNEWIFLHRFILDAQCNQIVDHANRDGLDNRRENIRFASHAENMRNRKPQKNSQYPYKGIKFDSRPKRHLRPWRAIIKKDNRRYYSPCYYETPEDAARAYDEMAKKLFGEFAKPNFAYGD